MPRLFSITNPKPLVEEKVNFFSDYFHYYLDNIGVTSDFRLENPLSLVEKILYQLENNISNPKCVSYISFRVEDTFFEEEEYLKNFQSFSLLKAEFESYKNQPDKKKYNWVKGNSRFLNTLKKFKSELEERMFKKSLESIISYLICEHPTEHHIKDIEFHTKIIATEFLFAGRSKEDLRKMFNQILSREISKFPFPKSIRTQKEKRDFIKKRTIEQQFEGFYNLLLKDISKRIYLFKVQGIEALSDFSFKYNMAHFYSKDSRRYQFLKPLLNEHLDDIFFSQNDTLIAEVSIEYFSSTIGKLQALEKINQAVRYLEVVLRKDLRVQTNTFLITHKFKDYQRFFTNENRPIKDLTTKLSDLNDNPFYIFKGKKILGSEHVKKQEHLFIKAVQTGAIGDYWHYVEVLLSIIDDEKHVQKIVSSIVLLGLQKFSDNFHFDSLFYSLHLFNTPSEKLGISLEEHKQILTALQKRKLDRHIAQIDYPFIKKMISNISNSRYDFKNEKKYYEGILKEAYEVRNFFIHKGIQNEKSLIKLEESLKFLIMRFRQVLFLELRRNRNMKFDELINALVMKSECL